MPYSTSPSSAVQGVRERGNGTRKWPHPAFRASRRLWNAGTMFSCGATLIGSQPSPSFFYARWFSGNRKERGVGRAAFPLAVAAAWLPVSIHVHPAAPRLPAQRHHLSPSLAFRFCRSRGVGCFCHASCVAKNTRLVAVTSSFLVFLFFFCLLCPLLVVVASRR